MLEMINDSKIWKPIDVQNVYKNCKYILVDYNNLEDIKGRLYCISKSKESFKEITRLNFELSKKGIKSILMGSYNDGGAIGVQYEVK